MPQTDRPTARNRGFVLIATVWETEDKYRLGGDAFRGATGLHRDGRECVLEDADGREFQYPPILNETLSVPEFFSTAPRSVSVTFPWLRLGLYPRDLDLRNAWGEIALVDEDDTDTGFVAWERRWVLVSAAARGPAGWSDGEPVTFTVQEEDVISLGGFWKPGAEVSASRFPDVDSTADRACAPNMKGKLLPLAYAPVGSSLRVPCGVLQDVVVPTYAARIFGLSPRRISTATTQFLVVDDKNDKRFTDTTTSTAYQTAPAKMTDALGTTYYGVTANWQQVIGTTVTFTNGSATATVPNQKDKLAAGDIIKGDASASDNHLELIDNISGDTLTLLANYTGTTQTTSGTAKAVLLPAGRADAAYAVMANGGVTDDSGTVISHISDVVKDWVTRYARPTLHVRIDDIEDVGQRHPAMRLGFFLRDRQDVLERCWKAMDMLLVRRFRHENEVRHQCVGPSTPLEIVTTIDLDDEDIPWRPGPVGWAGNPIYPVVEGSYDWDSLQGKYASTLAIDGTVEDLSDPDRVPSGRTAAAYGEWLAARAPRDALPRLSLELDMVETKTAAATAVATAAFRYARAGRTLELQLDASYRWMHMGDEVYIIEHKTIHPNTRWRLEARTIAASGLWRHVFEECDGVPGSLTRQPLWGEREGELCGEPAGAT